MTSGPIAVLTAVCAAVLATACAAKSAPAPNTAGRDLIVLLPDSGGTVGRATVSNPGGSVDLEAARASTLVAPGRPPSDARVLGEAEVQQVFGKVIAALPPVPRSFTLYFRFNSEELTDESRALLRDVLRSVRDRPLPEVVVLGHTDTTGTAARNFELGLKRANLVRGLLVATGVDSAAIEVRSHGERELIVPTGDGVFEPRNRRVEITVR